MLENKKIAFLGAGSMAEAMISGMIQTEKIKPSHIMVSNRNNKDRLHYLEKTHKIHGVTRENLNLKNIDIIILAMKPKDLDAALLHIRDSLLSHHLVLSILAGVSTDFIEQKLPIGQQVVRVMPNTSSIVRESAIAISPGKYTSEDNIILVMELLVSIGEVYKIDEKQMDIFTGIAGSGPAYFYYFMEHMEKAGIDAGLNKDIVRKMVSQTILGAAKMVHETGVDPAELRRNVTSPNGTTAAGLQALSSHGGKIAITKAITEAAKRSQEISTLLKKSSTGVFK